jgi:hypothetical protein
LDIDTELNDSLTNDETAKSNHSATHPFGLRLCRSAPAGSIPAPSIEMIYSGNTREKVFVTQANACVVPADTAVTSPVGQRVALQDVGSNRFL